VRWGRGPGPAARRRRRAGAAAGRKAVVGGGRTSGSQRWYPRNTVLPLMRMNDCHFFTYLCQELWAGWQGGRGRV
jgi:hypothetical protein